MFPSPCGWETISTVRWPTVLHDSVLMRVAHLPGQIKHVCVSIIEGEEDTGQAVHLLLCDGSGQILLHVYTHVWRNVLTYSSRPSGIKQFRPYLIPQCNLSSVPPGEARGEDTLQITQKHHAVHSAAFTVCFLFGWTHYTELNKQAQFKYRWKNKYHFFKLIFL